MTLRIVPPAKPRRLGSFQARLLRCCELPEGQSVEFQDPTHRVARTLERLAEMDLVTLGRRTHQNYWPHRREWYVTRRTYEVRLAPAGRHWLDQHKPPGS